MLDRTSVFDRWQDTGEIGHVLDRGVGCDIVIINGDVVLIVFIDVLVVIPTDFSK